MNTLVHDLRQASRQLRRSPAFLIVGITALALGIGGTTAIYSLYDQILRRRLPVREPEQLVNLTAPGLTPGFVTCNSAGPCTAVFSYPMFRDLQAASPLFAGIAAHRHQTVHLSVGDETEAAGALLVSGSYFPLLGLRPSLGRLLDAEDARSVGSRPVAVLSHRFWEARLGRDSTVLNRTVRINGYSLTIVGVASPSFEGTSFGLQPDVFVPITMREEINPGWQGFDDRRNQWLYLVARLMPGVAIDRAQRSINQVYGGLVEELEVPLYGELSPTAIERLRAKQIALEAGAQGQSIIFGNTRTPLLLLIAFTSLVLLIACATIGNILLARGSNRSREVAIRCCLGAGRFRLVVQFLMEAGLLALLAGAVSLIVARGTLLVIEGFLPDNIRAALDLAIRPATLLFAGVLSLGAALVFGTYPAINATSSDLSTGLKSAVRHASRRHRAGRVRMFLVTGQTALSITLLISAGLFVKSLVNIARIDLGFRMEDLVTFNLDPRLNGESPAMSRALFERLEAELAALPAVSGVSASFSPMLTEGGWSDHVSVEGFTAGPETEMVTSRNEIGAELFRVLGIPVLAGREFTKADGSTAPRVAIINQAFARRFGLDERTAVGRHMARGRDNRELDIEIIGVVPDAHYNGVKAAPQPTFFTPWRQNPDLAGLTFYIRTDAHFEQVLSSIRTIVHRLDPDLPVEDLKLMRDQAREATASDRVISTLASAFAVVATLLAALGLYGILAYDVAQRTREIGLRVAVGAQLSNIRWLVVRQVGWIILVGTMVGTVFALVLGKAAESLLFGIRGHDLQVVLSGWVVMVLVSVGAAYLPVRRAMRVAPIVALKAE